MKIKFTNNTIVDTSFPTEQKIIGDNGYKGWIINFSIFSQMGTNELDELLTESNISNMTLYSDDDEFSREIIGYKEIKFAVIRYRHNLSTEIEIQLLKQGE